MVCGFEGVGVAEKDPGSCSREKVRDNSSLLEREREQERQDITSPSRESESDNSS